MTYRYVAETGTWDVVCPDCEQTLETGFTALRWAVEETPDHKCEEEVAA